MTTTRTNPLLRPLTADETLLLELIAAPAFLPVSHTVEDMRWPVWQWVQGQFETAAPHTDADQVLAGLPVLPPYHPDAERPYGLTWTNAHTPEPMPHDRVGLTIAGLARIDILLVSRRVNLVGAFLNPDIAEILVGVLRDLATYEQQHVRPTPTSTGDQSVELRRFTGRLENNPAYVSPDTVSETLQREYFPTGISGQAASLTSGRLKPYRGLNTTSEYLEAIAAHAQRAMTASAMTTASSNNAGVNADVPDPESPAGADHLTVTALDSLHPAVSARPKVRSLWHTGHHLEAVGDAVRHLEARLATLARTLQVDPKNPTDVLSPKLGKLDVATTTRSADDERRGVHQLAMGLIAAIRNPRAHEDEIDDTSAEAFEYLAICSAIHRRLDIAQHRLDAANPSQAASAAGRADVAPNQGRQT